MVTWLKTRKQLIFNAVMAALLVSSIGLNISDKSSTTGSVRWGVGEKVITLGYVNDVLAAGTVDYTYNGTNDNIPWQNALNALPATGGRLVDVSAVTKHFSATVSRAIPNVVIEGAGFGSNFTNNNSATLFTSGVNWIFTNLSTDNGGITIVATTQLDKVMVGSVKYNNRTDGLSLLASINASTLNATQLTATTGNITTAYIVSGNASSFNMTSLNISTNITPSANNTANLGSVTRWFANLWTNTITAINGIFNTVNATTLNAPTGRGATYVIAASDAPAHVKAQADYIVSGNADDEINTAINLLPANGGVIRLSEGIFTLGSPIIVKDFTKLFGSGITATKVTQANNANVDLIQGYNITGQNTQSVEIAYMTLDGNRNNTTGGNGTRLAPWNSDIHDMTITEISEDGIHFVDNAGQQDTNRIFRIRFENCDGNGFEAETAGNWVRDSYFSSCGGSFIAVSGWQQDIIHNFFWSTPTVWTSYISLTNPSYSKVMNNDFADGDLANTGSVNIYATVNQTDILVSSNTFHTGTSLYAIVAEAAGGTSISNLQIENNIVAPNAGKTVTNGVNLVGTLFNVHVIGNIFSGAGTITNKVVSNAGLIVSKNVGYVTENSGNFTITAGQWGVYIPTLLATNATSWQLTLTSNCTTTVYVPFATVNSTGITANLSALQGSDITGTWRAVIGAGN